MVVLNKIYTKTGDTGETGLPGGARVNTESELPEACGAVNETNSSIGLVRAEMLPRDLDRML